MGRQLARRERTLEEHHIKGILIGGESKGENETLERPTKNLDREEISVKEKNRIV